ncbi:MAG: hypothetical protein LBC33_00955 [Mycoplasmataceae bacterium]|jgi:hypothetical protein|nr:hypothetical protein [Mycoplasmataceae bacterium]
MLYKYYQIKKEYLLQIYTKKQLILKKSGRPFINFGDGIYIPECTIHKNKQHKHHNKNWYEYCFFKHTHRLNISELIYVPDNMCVPMKNYNNPNNIEHAERLNEVQANIKYIQKKIINSLHISKKIKSCWAIRKSRKIYKQITANV